MSRRIFFLIAALPLAAAAEKRPVTVEDVVATRPPRSGSGAIRWAPDGKRFAFREGNSIWQYDAATRLRKEIVSLVPLREKAVKPPAAEAFEWKNRRVAESSYQWSDSGGAVLVEANGDLFLAQADSGQWKQLTATAEAERDPKLSPDGRRVAFRRGQDLYSLEIDSGKEARLTRDGSDTLLNGQLDWVYPEELDLSTAYWWSPDSRRIAYLQFDVSREPVFPQVDLLRPRAVFEPERYPKAGDPNADVRAGVVAASGGPTRWMDLGETRGYLLARVDWLPTGQGLAVQRLNRIQNRLELLLADPSSGSASLLLREQDPYWINVTDTYRFLKDGKRFLWSSERDGFRHLYLYSLDGKLASTVTRGEWEVTSLAGVDEAARMVYYVSTAKSPLERHLYRAGFDGKHAERLTRQPGVHSISMSPACDYYMDSASSLTEPPRRTLHSKDGKELAVYMEADRAATDELQILPTEIVKFAASDGAQLYGRLIKPAGFAPGRKYPAVVMIYGGPHAQTVRDIWAGASWDQALAARGFVIWQVDNRGSSGRGHKWESAIFRNLGRKELEDQKEGLRYLESLGFVDSSRIGIYGWSYGGFMTLYALCNAPDLFRAGIAGAPVTDFRNYDSIYTERYMGLPLENKDGYKSSSVVEKAADLKAKLLLVHNFSDDNVHFQNTLQMSDALQRAGKQFETMIYAQKSHGVTGPARKQMLEGLTQFLERNLK
ncbi:MAG TPA: S9 family peptidase [Bryobacteraceae bacterium]|jgi:dipeptidyl-peptidase-4|nr:S9 family peptidase [Bryobacteraceae bacterium]